MPWLERLFGRGLAPDAFAQAEAAFAAGAHAEALALWEPLARAGDARAQARIGACFRAGLGVAPDPALAARWLAPAAERGYPPALRDLALLLREGGAGVPADPARAQSLLAAAAEAGDAPAQDALSAHLLDRDPPDPVAARRWAQAAAEAGLPAAMTRLGMMAHNAQGGPRDVALAARWWAKAAARGEADAQAMLGAALHLGAGVPVDRVAALEWLIRATRGGSTLSRPFIPAVRAGMGVAEIMAAQDRAQQPLPPVVETPRMIVGTAGHIDHGKTALVRALTGVDTDRLKEEKARGITIELGFAYAGEGARSLGFVDVPGHERFVHTMLAGAGGIDFALLVVAADDGIMPQTREHLAILDLLGIRRGIVALSKADLADEARRAAVTAELRALLAPTGLAGATVLPVSTLTGEGIGALRAALDAAAEATGQRGGEGAFRLSVDRCFTLAGAGTVVTGTVLGGAVAVGEAVRISPSGLAARVRSLHAQNRPAERGLTGQRCALNLAGEGVGKDGIARGDMVLDPALHAPTDRIDAWFRALPSEPKPIGTWFPARLHHASAEVGARVVPLADPIAPGEGGFVQLVLDAPVAAVAGDRFILRDVSAQRTIGGGRFLDLRAPARKRRTPERLAQLDALALPEPAVALARLLELPPYHLDLAAFGRDHGMTARETEAMAAALDLVVIEAAGTRTALSRPRWDAYRARLAETLAGFHAENPDQQGIGRERLRLLLQPRLPASAFTAVLEREARAGALVLDGAFLRLPGHEVTLAEADEALFARIAPLLGGEARFRPPRVRDLVPLVEAAEPEVRRVLKLCARLGRVDQIAHDHFFLRATTAEMVEIARDVAAQAPDGWIAAAAFRDRMDNGRKVAIQILDFLDRLGVTLRRGDLRRMNPHRADQFRRVPADPAGREASPVGRPDFKSGWGSETVPGGFDSHSLPPPGAPSGDPA